MRRRLDGRMHKKHGPLGRWTNGWKCDVEVKLQLHSERLQKVAVALSSVTGNMLDVGCHVVRVAEKVGRLSTTDYYES
jgi:hypothetical protein